jgi:hypothetical protein
MPPTLCENLFKNGMNVKSMKNEVTETQYINIYLFLFLPQA